MAEGDSVGPGLLKSFVMLKTRKKGPPRKLVLHAGLNKQASSMQLLAIVTFFYSVFLNFSKATSALVNEEGLRTALDKKA